MQRENSPQIQPTFCNTRSKFFKKKQTSVSKSPSISKKESTGEYWKNKGNQAIKKGLYQTAIEHYTKAIDQNNGESIYYSNRAKCYRQLNMLDKALKDAEQACQLDDRNIKAHYMCGCILAEIAKKDDSKLSKAQNRLKKALRLCDSLKKSQFIDSISIKLYRVRKMKYMKQEQKKQQYQRQIAQLIKKSYVQGVINKQKQDYLAKMQQNLKLVSNIKKKEIPSYLLCHITLQLMEEPVTTQAGFSYQKDVIQDHFQHNGYTDPMTRKQLSGKLYPNQNLKLAIHQYLQENPWAFQYVPGQSYHHIIF